MTIKRIEMDWMMGSHHSIFTEACKLSLQHQCDQVIFEFNGGKFSVSRKSVWNDSVHEKLMEFPRKEHEVEL